MRIERGESINNIVDRDMFVEYPDVLSIDDLKSMLHIGQNTAYKLLQDDLIKTFRIGKKYIIPKASVIDFVLSIS
ncbi:MAG: helix-turn-helix domain-containing protein [Ruminococcus sp.]